MLIKFSKRLPKSLVKKLLAAIFEKCKALTNSKMETDSPKSSQDQQAEQANANSLIKVTFFCDTQNIIIYPDLDYEFKGLRLSMVRPEVAEDKKKLNQLIGRAGVASLGTLYINRLYRLAFFTSQVLFKSIEQCYEYSNGISHYLESVLTSIWFVKDHSFNIGTLAAISDTSDVDIFTIDRSMKYSNARGHFEDDTLDISEIIASQEYFKQIISAIEYKDSTSLDPYIEKVGLIPGDERFIEYNDINRINRAYLFLQDARSTTMLPAKIAGYILVIESLFSGGDTEGLQHKLGQRVANFIGTMAEEKRNVFKLVKFGYSIRSGYFHGDLLNEKGKRHTLEYLSDLSNNLDQLIRRLLIKILGDPKPFLMKSGDLQVWLDDKMFGEDTIEDGK